jgi:hypothetical protein
VEKKYLEYTVEEMVDDRNFLLWLNHQFENHELDKLFINNPQFARKVSQAREIILLLSENEVQVSQDDVNSIWENIFQFDRSYQIRLRNMKYQNFLKYAAAIIFVLMLSALGYWKIRSEKEHQWYAFKNDQSALQSRLILSSGEEIDLKKNESTIRLNTQNHVISINNDSIISLSDTGSNMTETAMNQVVVPFGKKSVVELADGTKVWLNAGSRMAFPDRFTGSRREVFLEGEAYFNVTSDKNKPFLVKTKDIVIRVYGTKFNLSAYDSDKDVMTVLVEGTVSLSENKGLNLFGKEIILNSHHSALFNKTDLTTKIYEEAHTEIYTAWTEGWFPFYKEPLSNVFKKLERYYNVQFEYNELFPSGDLISGKLDLKESIEGVMKVLADVAKISYRIDEKKIHIELNREMPMRR